jgi:glycine/serine hydroxymethyltransferase
MAEIARLIDRVLERPDDVGEQDRVRVDVEALCDRFPLYADRWDR